MKRLDQFPGPWAIVLLDLARRRVLFGRDALGRRSLVLRTAADQICISSVADSPDFAEVPPGVHSLCLQTGRVNYNLHKFPTSYEDANFFCPVNALPVETAVTELYAALRAAIAGQLAAMAATVQVAILFSGGIDSTVIAGLVAVQAENLKVDLINVSFAVDSPDRRTALVSYADLERKFPGRFRLLLTQVSEAELEQSTGEIVALISPKDTHMDFNIGAALYFAGRGVGRLVDRAFVNDPQWPELKDMLIASETLDEGLASSVPTAEKAAVVCTHCETRTSKAGCTASLCRRCCVKIRNPCRVHKRRVDSDCASASPVVAASPSFAELLARHTAQTETVETAASVLLVGHGADELLGGYGRYKTREVFGSLAAKRAEMVADLQRFWTRNLGRDDRCLSAHGRETRHPFWDERVLAVAGRLPSMSENKGLLRAVVRQFLGDFVCADFRKRAIQFGTRIAQQSNVRCFGSHRQRRGSAVFSGAQR